MKYFLALHSFALVTAIFASGVSAQPVPTTPPALPQIGFSIIKTSKVAVTERLLLPDGSLSKKIDTNFSAFLIKHKNDYMLFDTGLGSKIEAQYSQDMPYWQRPFFKFEKPVLPARKQLDDAGFAPVQKVIISHSHWDHAGGVQDFRRRKSLRRLKRCSPLPIPGLAQAEPGHRKW